jgi:hypothetical protein
LKSSPPNLRIGLDPFGSLRDWELPTRVPPWDPISSLRNWEPPRASPILVDPAAALSTFVRAAGPTAQRSKWLPGWMQRTREDSNRIIKEEGAIICDEKIVNA